MFLKRILLVLMIASLSYSFGGKVIQDEEVFIPYSEEDIRNVFISNYFTGFGEIEAYGKNVSKNQIMQEEEFVDLTMDNRFSKVSISLFVSRKYDVMGMMIRYDNRSTVNAYISPDDFEIMNAKFELKKVNPYRFISVPEHRDMKLVTDFEEHLLDSTEIIEPDKWDYFYLFYQRPLESSITILYKGEIPFKFGVSSQAELQEKQEFEELQRQMKRKQDELKSKEMRIDRFGRPEKEDKDDDLAEEQKQPEKPKEVENRKFFTF